MAPDFPTISLFPAQIAAVASYFLVNPEVALSYGLAPAELGALLPDRPETLTYHLGTVHTAGRGYDDRLTVHLGLSRDTLAKEIALWHDHAGRLGGLRSARGGNKHIVSELACREWLGDSATHQSSRAKRLAVSRGA